MEPDSEQIRIDTRKRRRKQWEVENFEKSQSGAEKYSYQRQKHKETRTEGERLENRTENMGIHEIEPVERAKLISWKI